MKKMRIDDKLIKEWKDRNPGKDIFLITVDDKGCVLRSPGRQDLSYASVVKNPMKMNEVLVNQLWVAGDEEMRTDDSLFMALCNKLEEVLKVKDAEIKKL